MIFEEDVDSFLLRYLLNELDPKDREKVEEWIVANEENRRYYQAYQKTHLELRWMERSKKIEGNFIQFDRLRRKQHFSESFLQECRLCYYLVVRGRCFPILG
ncbi:MAG: hypothetical protein V8R91_07600 [Butyricimonas faecihominis]